MRKSLLVGLFLSAAFFVVSSASAEAATLDITKINNIKPAMEQLLEAAENVDINEAELAEIPAETKPEIIKHTVAASDSLSSIAKLHNTEWKRIYNKNPTIKTPDVISAGAVIVIPGAEEVLEERLVPVAEPAVQPTRLVASASSTAQAPVQPAPVARGSSSGNRYVAGYCTWLVKEKRPDLPNNLGNAYSWVSRAAAQGLATGSTPRAGAVAQRNNHVAYVKSVNSDGTINIVEMNYQSLYTITHRTVPGNQWSYIY